MAVEITAKTKRGILEKTDAIVMKLVHTVYMVGALALGVVKDKRTSRNLPKPPVGDRTAATSPPTSFPPASPAFQAGTYTAAAVNAAPIRCMGT